MNTPAYFCMDKLSVISEPESSIASVGADTAITYDRASTAVYAPGFLAVYDTAGNHLISSENGSADISTLPAGVYLVKSAGACRKIVR